MITGYSNIISVTTLEALLLDNYPNAAAAYSLRQLATAYTGSAIRVRIDTTGQPEYNIGFVDGELDVSTLQGYCTGGLNAFVTTWYDQSGNARNATQSTATNQPQIVSSGSVITQGGKASLYTTLSGNKNLNTGLLTLPVSGDIDLDFFAVLNHQSTNFESHLFALNTNTSDFDRRRVYCYANDTGTTISIRLYGGNTIYTNTTTGQLLFNTNYQGGGGAFNSRINGSSLSVNSFGNTGLNIQASSGFMLMSGQTGYFLYSTNPNSIGYMQECIFYLSDESSNRTGIESNINSFYSIY